jgi:hypothetical protein
VRLGEAESRFVYPARRLGETRVLVRVREIGSLAQTASTGKEDFVNSWWKHLLSGIDGIDGSTIAMSETTRFSLLRRW